ncbi:CHAT domain-containing protein [Reichenbachiella faecimaris]|uniref:CHAT domain-containing protein n=1 Tax=Reichenbachiella faecimaris TaxID=692418 RepID=A0A1W2GKU1_REIFA|nr:CHAT domain-containing tetratricopeptide repeat protein [Reichenbachiella faecimaris]SMD36958.1 CHAT domain-containing protein [Reichenbachiella faecimaris]
MKLILLLTLVVFQDSLSVDNNRMVNAAQKSYQEADYSGALEMYAKIIESNQSDNKTTDIFRMQFKLVDCLIKLERNKEASTTLKDLRLELWRGQHQELYPAYFLHAGNLELALDNDTKAIEMLDSAKMVTNDALQLIEIELRLMDVYALNRDLISATQVLDEIKELSNQVTSTEPYAGDILLAEGRLLGHKGEFNRAIKVLNQALELKKKSVSDGHPDLAIYYQSLGLQHQGLLQYDKALEYFSIALDIKLKYFGQRHLSVSDTYNAIGFVLYKKALAIESLEFHRKALSIRKEKLQASNYRIKQSKEMLGISYAKADSFAKAEKLFLEVYETRVKDLGENNHYVSYSLYNLGALAEEVLQYEKALVYFKRVVEMGNKIYGENNADQADNLNRLARMYWYLGYDIEAKKTYQRALEHNFPEYKFDGHYASMPDSDYYLTFRECNRSLLGLAGVYGNSNNIDSLRLAVPFIKKAEEYLNKHKLRFYNNTDLTSISQSYKFIAENANVILYKLAQRENKKEYLEEIFRLSEQARGSALNTQINEQKARANTGISVEMTNKDEQIRAKKDSLNSLLVSMMRDDEDLANIQPVKKELFELNRQQEKLILEIEEKYPKYSELKYGQRPVSVSNVKSYLKEQEDNVALMQYLYTDREQLMIMLITKDIYEVVFIDDSLGLNSHVERCRKSIETFDKESFEKSADLLNSILIAPVKNYLDSVDRMVIIPDGVISLIPFDVICDNNNIEMLPYVISYDLSATLLLSRKPSSKRLDGFLAYAPVFDDQDQSSIELGGLVLRSDALVNLPGAIDEVKMTGEIMNGTIRIGDEASEFNFKNEASGYSIIHLATHSIIDQSSDQYSKLIFSGSGTDEDNYLHAFELANMDMEANLVTLSACNTGVGKLEDGEGIMSMARSFRSAGVHSVAMSLWPASDKSTPELMKYFYQNLKAGQRKSVALNNARKQYLTTATGKARHPFYWAGFVVIGDDSPITSENSNIAMILSILFLLTAVPIVLVIKNKYLSID